MAKLSDFNFLNIIIFDKNVIKRNVLFEVKYYEGIAKKSAGEDQLHDFA